MQFSLEPYPYIDFHTHKRVHAGDDDVVEIISMHSDVKKEAAWYTVGFHPWWSHTRLLEQDLAWLHHQLEDEKACIGVGECGLDGLKGADAQIQEKNFEIQLSIAEKFNAPVIIHCVRRYDRLLQIRKHWRSQQWVVHGYRRNKMLTKQLLDEGIKLSVSPFDSINPSFAETLSYLPDNDYFLETDSDHRVDIVGRYRLMAELRKIDIFALRKQMYQNCCNFFQWKQWPQPGLSAPHY
ncbi:MAG: TatD family hydrolase [Saprospiraceae bacterium]|jgi:TatD DNase family protein|nr:TatD family hydrolase [Saprospiraceae bacterium]